MRLASAWLIAVPVTELVMSVKLTPLSFEYSKISSVKRPVESVAVTVKPALSDVIKSVAELPLSVVMLLIATVLVGAVVSIVINCVATVPVLSAVSVTLNWTVLVLVRLVSEWLIAVPVTELVVMSVKLTPLSFEYSRISPVKRPLESVAVTVKPSLSDVIKSVAKLPVSSVMPLIVTVLVGTVVSIVIA